jgi:hypothetical protein
MRKSPSRRRGWEERRPWGHPQQRVRQAVAHESLDRAHENTSKAQTMILEAEFIAQDLALDEPLLESLVARFKSVSDRSPGLKGHFGMGSMMMAFSANDASPGLPLILYWTFSSFGVPGSGSPPKLAL